MFGVPGIYEITFVGGQDNASNTLSIVVEPSTVEARGLALLHEPEDFRFLASDADAKPQTVARLENLIEECPGTRLAQMAAARLGVEFSRQLEEKYPDGEGFMERYRRGEADEPLVEKAHAYLSGGYELPDAFPLREAVLSNLAVTEWIRGNRAKTLSLLDELEEKYPLGEYGRRATSAKAEFSQITDAVTERPASRRPLLPEVWQLVVVTALIGILWIVGRAIRAGKRTRNAS